MPLLKAVFLDVLSYVFVEELEGVPLIGVLKVAADEWTVIGIGLCHRGLLGMLGWVENNLLLSDGLLLSKVSSCPLLLD